MKTKNRTLTAMLVGGIAVASLLTGCVKQEDEIFTENAPESAEKASKQIFGDSIVLGERLNNPYSIQNMQAAYNQVMATRGDAIDEVALQPNLLYVRFLPQDSADVAFLQESGLELFDYPLDYDIVVMGNSYHDPSLPDTALTWQYSCVRPGFTFPDMTYEVIEECFVPDEETSSTRAGIDWDEVEEAAFLNADLPEKYLLYNTSTTRASTTQKKCPYGTLTVRDDYRRESWPIKGAKIRCHSFVKICTTHTDSNGHYEMSKSFNGKTYFSIIYDNIKGFSIWENNMFLSSAVHNFGDRDYNFTKTIYKKDGNSKWILAVINTAAYEYYEMCKSEGIKLPPNDLKISSFEGTENMTSAPMLHHIVGIGFAGIGIDFALETVLGTICPALVCGQLLLAAASPDITIGGYVPDDDKYGVLHAKTWHELSHASHFSQVGELYWGRYINHIVTHGGYGTSSNSVGWNICELGESWAYANELYDYKSMPICRMNDDMFCGISGWLKKNNTLFIYNLISRKVLSIKELYSCLTSDVKSMSEFKSKLYATYPEKEKQIRMYDK